jgi:hypothetical protein
MKGLTTIILRIISLVVSIGIIILLVSIFYLFSPQSANTSMPPASSSDKFDYTPYLLSQNPVANSYFSSVEFCNKLRNAIKWSVLTGKPQKVDEVEYGSDIYSKVNLGNGLGNFPVIGNCPTVVLQNEVASGLNQTVCNFQTNINQNMPQGNINTYGGISDAANLYFNNCSYNPEPYGASPIIQRVVYGYDGSNLVGPQEVLNHPGFVWTYYSPDYLYIQDGNYPHPSNNVNNNNVFNNAYNGAGKLNIYVGGAKTSNGNCVYNIYFCPRPAIAISTLNSTISIFKIFRDLELIDLKMIPYYIRDITSSANPMTVNSINYDKRVYYWNYYDVKLDGDYKVETIINAIKSGMYENVYAKNYFWAHPHWDIEVKNINKNNECWDSSFDALLNSANKVDRTRSIMFNCSGGGVNTCSGNLTIKVALRVDFNNKLDVNSDGKDESLNFVSGVISFCDT